MPDILLLDEDVIFLLALYDVTRQLLKDEVDYTNTSIIYGNQTQTLSYLILQDYVCNRYQF